MRVKIIKNHKNYHVGQILSVTPNVGFGLVDKGIAIVTTDMVASEFSQKEVNRSRKKKYGNPS